MENILEVIQPNGLRAAVDIHDIHALVEIDYTKNEKGEEIPPHRIIITKYNCQIPAADTYDDIIKTIKQNNKKFNLGL